MTPSAKCLELIKSYEGFSAKLYNCPAGDCTIGYGHKVHNGPIDGSLTEKFYSIGITRESAERLLAKDVAARAGDVNKLVLVTLTQGQFDALVSFAYNVGVANLAGSTLLHRLNGGNYDAVPEELQRWCFVHGVVSKGLVARRNAEAALFLAK